MLRQAIEQDVRLVYSGGWRDIAEDDEAVALAAPALAALLADVADATGLSRGFSGALARLRRRAGCVAFKLDSGYTSSPSREAA